MGVAPVRGASVCAVVHLHLDVVERLGRLGEAGQRRPAEVKVEDGGPVGAAAGRVRSVRAERRRHVLRVDVVVRRLQGRGQGVGVGVVEAVVIVAVERGRLQAAAAAALLLLRTRLPGLPNWRQGRQVLVVQQGRAPLGRVVDILQVGGEGWWAVAARSCGGIGGAVGEGRGLSGGLSGAVGLPGLLGLLRLLLSLLLLHQLPLNGGGAQHETNSLRLQQHLRLRLGGRGQGLAANPRRRRRRGRALRLRRGGALQRGGGGQRTGLLLQEPLGVDVGVNLHR